MVSRRWSIAGGVAVAWALYNAWVTLPVALALADEAGPTAWVYRRWLLSPDEIVFDLRDPGPDATPGKVDRPLFLAAHALAGQSFEQIVLSYRGAPRFLLDGERFRQIGRQWLELDETTGVQLITSLHKSVKESDGTAFLFSRSARCIHRHYDGVEYHLELHRRWWAEPYAVDYISEG